MSWSGLLVFMAAYGLAVFSPGPAVAAVIARTLGVGLARTLPFIAGIVLGDLVWFSFTALGLAVLAQSFYWLFSLIKYAGAAYLLFLAWKLWTAPASAVAPAPMKGEGLKLFAGGLSLTLGNPKVMIFFLAILPNIMDLDAITAATFVEVGALIVVTLSAAMLSYAILAQRARRLVSSPRAVRIVNRTTGTVMAGAAVAIAAKG
ncbi:MAG: LysE family translocator [Beijerinckiaceae bacterium]|nr:LysE family translocator [Beijerinckiaceae bacterium]